MRFSMMVLAILCPFGHADVPPIMNDIVALRAEIETQSREVDASQREWQAELDLWVQKKLELEGMMQRETLRNLQLQETKSRLTRTVQNESKASGGARKEFSIWLSQAMSWVEQSLPFQKQERLDVLKTLQQRAESGVETLEALSSELWLFYEAELKMSGENEFRLIDIESPQGSQKMESARLGFYTMYLRGADGGLQQVVALADKWRLEPVPQRNHSDVLRLLENLKAKKRSGLYSIPLAKETL